MRCAAPCGETEGPLCARARGRGGGHRSPRTCGSCELACGARGGSWHNNSWTSAGNTWDGAVWGDEERVLLTSPILPTVFTLLLAWITASVFMFVYAMVRGPLSPTPLARARVYAFCRFGWIFAMQRLLLTSSNGPAQAIDTILVCFCEDKEQGGDGNPFFMSKNLKKFVKDNQSKEGGGDTAKP